MKSLPHSSVPHMAPDVINELLRTPTPKGTKAMLLYEDLARERRLEAERVARHLRLVRQLSAVKRWERISEWAARRARRASALI
ncbi:MAG TPA: hypothetical protein VFV67_18065 [Actinophytocola sp.]|uniref:hypothetical protein n=1 Tax=Actinophytocola sp. TaxID=1872138 RepID=UPI002DB9C636|nr:hypothetical protein [Actinophytocola sp.]HEU5472557.1 hypothetical protein [Actinophytocola sp.]